MTPGTICPVVMYAPTRAIRPTRANLPFKFSALIFFISGKDDFGRTKNKYSGNTSGNSF